MQYTVREVSARLAGELKGNNNEIDKTPENCRGESQIVEGFSVRRDWLDNEFPCDGGILGTSGQKRLCLRTKIKLGRITIRHLHADRQRQLRVIHE